MRSKNRENPSTNSFVPATPASSRANRSVDIIHASEIATAITAEKSRAIRGPLTRTPSFEEKRASNCSYIRSASQTARPQSWQKKTRQYRPAA